MLNRPVYIDLEGADLTGKTTLLKTTFRKGDYSKILCFHDRGILTHYVYNMNFGRYPEDLDLWHHELIEFAKYNGIIILAAQDLRTLEDRFKQRGGDDLFRLGEIFEINEQYKLVYCSLLYIFPTVKLIYIENKTPKQIYEEAEKLYYDILEKVTCR